MKMNRKSWNDYKDRSYLTVIPSRGRSRYIDHIPDIFPDAVLYVNETELEDYSKTTPIPIITHRHTKGIQQVTNGILDSARAAGIKYVGIFDDDMYRVKSLVGNRERLIDNSQIPYLLDDAWNILEDSEIKMFLFSTAQNIILFSNNRPFKLGIWIPQGAYVISTAVETRMNEDLTDCCDVDFVLEYRRKYRIAVQDTRYVFTARAMNQAGGCVTFRNKEDRQRSIEYICNKWGKYATYGKTYRGAEQLLINLEHTKPQNGKN